MDDTICYLDSEATKDCIFATTKRSQSDRSVTDAGQPKREERSGNGEIDEVDNRDGTCDDEDSSSAIRITMGVFVENEISTK